jgi:hypothetical protein
MKHGGRDRYMQKPNLENMWEFFIRIPAKADLGLLHDMIRFQVFPIVSRLMSDGAIEWYSFLVHNRESGVPTAKDDNNVYFHVRVSFKNGYTVSKEELDKLLPDYCQKHLTKKCTDVKSINGIEQSSLKNGDLAEAWRIIGEQSEWVMRMLEIHNEGAQVPVNQIAQFLHYFSNMTQLRVQ